MIIEIYIICYWIIFGKLFINFYFDQKDSLGAPGYCLIIGLSFGFSIGLTSLYYLLFSLILKLNFELYILSEIVMIIACILLLVKITNYKLVIKNIRYRAKRLKLKSIELIDIVCLFCVYNINNAHATLYLTISLTKLSLYTKNTHRGALDH